MKKIITFLSFLFSLNLCAQTYCAPPFATSGFGKITSVDLHTLHNSAGGSGTFGYLYSGAAPILYRDSTYTLRIELDSPKYGTWAIVAIPFDTTLGYLTFYTANRFYAPLPNFHNVLSVTVPHDAAIGFTRMRIVRYGGGAPIPHICNDGIPNGTYGESQDYPIEIRDTPPPPITLSTPEINTTNKIYPNPTKGILHTNGKPVMIYNTFGQVVYQSYGESEIDITFLPSGIYYANKQVIQKQ